MHYFQIPSQPNDFISAADASARFGITNDYITRLCRSKKVAGIFVGRVWFVDVASLQTHLDDARDKRAAQRRALSLKLRADYAQHRSLATP